ncbi:MAG: hypothetical protein H7Y28_00030 [Rhodoferax sp.]|nr:hypothetical protein [Rhodoferax sp.]
MRMFLARASAATFVIAMYALLPLLPVLASLVFVKWKYCTEYRKTLAKMLTHLAALRKGPTVHFFHDVLGRVSAVPETIHGECIQCGNCCMNHQCMFLEQVDAKRFQCGIYHSPLRRLSNCSSFPLNRYDIERYACPSYFVTAQTHQPVQWVPRVIIEMRD